MIEAVAFDRGRTIAETPWTGCDARMRDLRVERVGTARVPFVRGHRELPRRLEAPEP